VTEVNDGLAMVLEYNTDLFDGSTILRLLEHYEVLLRSIVETPEQALSRLSMLTERELHSILIERNRSAYRTIRVLACTSYLRPR